MLRYRHITSHQHTTSLTPPQPTEPTVQHRKHTTSHMTLAPIDATRLLQQKHHETSRSTSSSSSSTSSETATKCSKSTSGRAHLPRVSLLGRLGKKGRGQHLPLEQDSRNVHHTASHFSRLTSLSYRLRSTLLLSHPQPGKSCNSGCLVSEGKRGLEAPRLEQKSCLVGKLQPKSEHTRWCAEWKLLRGISILHTV